MTRKEQTTDHLRDVACDILARSGARAFTQEAIARDGYASIGSIYARWPSKSDTLADLADNRIAPAITTLARDAARTGTWAGASRLLDSPDGRRELQLAVEILLAARDDSALARHALALKDGLETIARFADDASDDGLTWWLTCLIVGWGMLTTGEFALPPVADQLRAVLRASPTSVDERQDLSTEDLPKIPPSPAPVPTDNTGKAVKSSVRKLLGSRTATELNTNAITAASQVSISTLYRRFPSRSELLRSILVDEMQSERYSWSKDLIEAATIDRAVDVVVDITLDAMRRVYDNTDEQTFLLEITTAARVDLPVRQQLTSQITASVEARTRLFDRLRDAGFLTRAITGEELAWLFQAPPIGARLLGALGHRPTDDTMRSGLRRVCGALLTDN